MIGRIPVGVAFYRCIIELVDSECEVADSKIEEYCNQHSFCDQNDILANRDTWACIVADLGDINAAMRGIGGQPLKDGHYWIDERSLFRGYPYYCDLHRSFCSFQKNEAFIRPILTNF